MQIPQGAIFLFLSSTQETNVNYFFNWKFQGMAKTQILVNNFTQKKVSGFFGGLFWYLMARYYLILIKIKDVLFSYFCNLL